jgi:hypothetical protein
MIMVMIATVFSGFAITQATVRAQDGPSLEIVSPAGGDVVTENAVEVTVKIDNFTLNCATAGRPNEDGVGHIHVMIDGMTMANLINFYCTDTFSLPLAGLEPGTHTIIIGLANNLHMDMKETMREVQIDYQPTAPVELPEADVQGVPTATLLSPADGATVPAVFTVEIEPVNYTVDTALEGKPNVPGHGHWHVFIDTMDPMASMEAAMMEMTRGTPTADGAMAPMPMPNLVLMPGTNSFELDLTAWGPGEHTILIIPAQNDHTMLEDFMPLMFTVIVE